jgi:2-oxoglutarate ferredoxin oxidoreductase subunit alpha
MTALTLGAVEEIGATKKDGQRAKNMFALGLLSWMYGRPIETSQTFIREKFARKPDVAEANVLALKAGWNYGETTEAFGTTYEVSPARLPAGEYRQISGNTALAYGIVTAGQLAGIRVVLGSYPITPASDILHELSKHKNFNVVTFQAEDEIAGIGAALGASYGGALGITSTSGPGLSLKAEAIGLAVMTELPLLVIDVQRGGPSTGLPTRTEQADLLQALYGRNGESPVAVLAPRSPSDCFDTAVEAARIAVSYHTPVIVLSDGAIANGSEPWRITDVDTLEPIEHVFAKPDEPFQPYARNPGPTVRNPGNPRAGTPHRGSGNGQRLGQHLL